jgi:hypothetical protein
MLDDFDKQLEKRGLRFVRYADDFIIFVKSCRAGTRVSASVRRFLERRLKLAVRELRRMGTSLKSAIFAGISRKGPWRCARTKTTQIGISNQWFANRGLICIKDLWVKSHYPAKAR